MFTFTGAHFRLDAILLMYYAYVKAQHVSATIMPITRSSRCWRWLPHRPSGSRVAVGWRLNAGRMDECPDQRL